MNIISPKGKIDILIDPELKDVADSLVNFFDELSVEYNIGKFSMDIYIGKTEEGLSGYCLQNKDNYRDFTLALSNDMLRKDFILSVIHEFKHIQQFLDKRAVTVISKKTKKLIWEGVEYDYKYINSLTERDWKKLPWEVEAI